MNSLGSPDRIQVRPTKARSAESYKLLNYIHGIVPVRHTHKIQEEVVGRGVVANVDGDGVARETSKTHSKDLNDCERTTTLNNMHTIYGLRKSAMIPAALSIAPSAPVEAPFAMLVVPSRVPSVTDSITGTKPAPFFDHAFDTTTQVFTTAIRASHASEVASTKAVISDFMGFQQFSTTTTTVPKAAPTAPIPTKQTTGTPLWPLWVLLPLISILTCTAVWIYIELIAKPIALRHKRTVGSQDCRNDDAGGNRRNRRCSDPFAMVRGDQLYRRSIQPLHGREAVQKLGLPHDGLAGMHSHTPIPNHQSGSARLGAADAHMAPTCDIRLGGAANTLCIGRTHASHMAGGVQSQTSRAMEQQGSYDQKQFSPSRADGAATFPVQHEGWPPHTFLAQGRRDAAAGNDNGGPVTPSYASGISLAFPPPASWHHGQDSRTYTTPVHTSIHDQAVLRFQRVSNSELRQRKQRVPQLRVDTTLANGGYYANYATNFDIESQVAQPEPQPVISQSRSWLSLPSLAHGSNRDSSSNASRTHSRSSSTSSFLTDLVDGVAKKIADFTNDSGEPEDGLLLPITAQDRREADAMGGEA